MIEEWEGGFDGGSLGAYEDVDCGDEEEVKERVLFRQQRQDGHWLAVGDARPVPGAAQAGLAATW